MPDIAIWNRCNNHCLMCSNPFDYQLLENSDKYTFDLLKSRWAKRKILLDDNLSLTGGEPTSHPDFFKIISWLHSDYPYNKIVIASNGRMFSYLDFTKNLLKINNLKIEIAIHGYDAITHDFITRTKGSFAQAVKGIHNVIQLKNNSQEIEIRIIITKYTYKNLDKILEFIVNEFDLNKIHNVVLIFVELEGQAQDNIHLIGLTYSEVMRVLPKVIERWSSKISDLRLYHFPLCVLPPKLWPYTFRTLRQEEVVFLPRCNKCFYKKYCLGIHYDYIPLMGDKEFIPPKKIKIKATGNYLHPIKKVYI